MKTESSQTLAVDDTAAVDSTAAANGTFRNRLVNVIRLAAVLTLSLVLLIFVGQGEARRTYPRFAIEKLAAQGELVQTAMKGFLLADLPLSQFPGFTTSTQPILQSDPSIYAIYVTNLQEAVVFASGQSLAGLGDLATQAAIQPEDARYLVTENAQFYRVSFDLRDRYAVVGSLHVLLPKTVVEAQINQAFLPVQGAAVIAVCAYMIFLFFTSKRWMSEDESGWQKGAGRLLGLSYGVAFLAVAVLTIISLTTIYQNGIRAKIQALANSLEYRLDSAFSLGLNLNDFSGLETMLNEYRTLNPDLAYVAMTRDAEVIFHTDPASVGAAWEAQSDVFNEAVPLVKSEGEAGALSLQLGISKSVVYNRLWRSAKNFLALFVASIFLANLFFSLIRALSNRPNLVRGKLHLERSFLLSLIGPLYFVAIFTIHGLATAFLPQYFKTLAAEGNSGLGIGIDVSTLFSTYYITYAIALFATSKPADKYGPKPFLVIGAGLIVAELLLLSFVRNFYLMYLVQVITGLGEGMLFNAVFTYIITVASKKERTRGAGIIVTSLSGGLLSGTAIGALLAADPTIGLRGVFLIGAGLAVLIFLYAYFAIPSFRGETFGEHELAADDRDPTSMAIETVTQADMRAEIARETERRRIASAPFFERLKYRLGLALGDWEFFKTAVMIGMPVKIIMAGFFKASLPLLLAGLAFAMEDIGQIMMLYYGGVLLSNAIITRLTDKLGNTRLVLFIGGISSGLGLILIGLIGWDALPVQVSGWMVVLLLVGMTLLGLAHGFIQAPIITHISHTQTAQRHGQATASSLYRLYERIGNIAGPLLISAILVASNYDPFSVVWIGSGVLFLGLLFAITPTVKPTGTQSRYKPPEATVKSEA